MKKIFYVIFAVFLFSCTAFASENFELSANGSDIDISSVPVKPYIQNESVMIPIRAVSQKLGYDVGWNEKTGEITVEDFVQKTVLKNNSKYVEFKGKLEIIDLNRNVILDEKAEMNSGCTYVPLEFFEEFFNDIKREDRIVTITPSTSELCAIETEPPKSDVESINSLLL